MRRNPALLGSLCLFLSALEYLIPKPLPFMRIGLANLPLLLALSSFGAGDFFLLALMKVIGQGIMSGTLFSYVFLFSLAGTFSSAFLMYGMRGLLRRGWIGFAGIGCAGAMLSNGVQLLLARYFVFGGALRFLVPPFLASGFIGGIGLGLFSAAFCRRSQWYTGTGSALASSAPVPEERSESPPPPAETRRLLRQEQWVSLFNGNELFIAGLAMAALFLLNPSIPFKCFQFCLFCVIAWFSGKKNNLLITFFIMAGVVVCNLLVPYGKTLAVFWGLYITEGSLLAGIEKALVVEGLAMLSRACVTGGIRFPGRIGLMLGESFRLLELMRERKGMIRRGNIIAGIDRLLLELDSGGAGADSTVEKKQYARAGKPAKRLIVLAAMTLLTAALTAGALLLH